LIEYIGKQHKKNIHQQKIKPLRMHQTI